MKTEKEIKDKLKELESKKWYKKFFYPYDEYKIVVRVLKWVLESSDINGIR